MNLKDGSYNLERTYRTPRPLNNRSDARQKRWPDSPGYLRAPRCGFLSFDWRIFRALRLGLLMMKVPLP